MGPSPTGRKALAGRARGAPGHLTTPVAGWPWGRSHAATVSARREKWSSSPSGELFLTGPPQARWPW